MVYFSFLVYFSFFAANQFLFKFTNAKLNALSLPKRHDSRWCAEPLKRVPPVRWQPHRAGTVPSCKTLPIPTLGTPRSSLTLIRD